MNSNAWINPKRRMPLGVMDILMSKLERLNLNFTIRAVNV